MMGRKKMISYKLIGAGTERMKSELKGDCFSVPEFVAYRKCEVSLLYFWLTHAFKK